MMIRMGCGSSLQELNGSTVCCLMTSRDPSVSNSFSICIRHTLSAVQDTISLLNVRPNCQLYRGAHAGDVRLPYILYCNHLSQNASYNWCWATTTKASESRTEYRRTNSIHLQH